MCSWSKTISPAYRPTSKLVSASNRPPEQPRRPLPPPEASTLPPERSATTLDKGHGRVEKRTLRTTSILTLQEKWCGAQQGFEVIRERTQGGKKTVDVVYGLTSL